MPIPRLHGANICRVVGIILFCAALLLPSCQLRSVGRDGKSVPSPTASGVPREFNGYQCAGLALFVALFVVESFVLNSWAAGSLSAGMKSVQLSMIMCALSVAALPLFVFFTVLKITPRFTWLRRGLAAFTLICASASVVFFSKTDSRPLLGWYVWMAGILISIAPEAISTFRSFVEGVETTVSN
jgi:hypothetical protein